MRSPQLLLGEVFDLTQLFVPFYMPPDQVWKLELMPTPVTAYAAHPTGSLHPCQQAMMELTISRLPIALEIEPDRVDSAGLLLHDRLLEQVTLFVNQLAAICSVFDGDLTGSRAALLAGTGTKILVAEQVFDDGVRRVYMRQGNGLMVSSGGPNMTREESGKIHIDFEVGLAIADLDGFMVGPLSRKKCA